MAETAPPTYTQSAMAGKEHLGAFARSTIGAHPKASLVLIGVLVVGVLILTVKLQKAKAGKEGYLTPYPNTGMHSQWHLGSVHAGMGGTVDAPLTTWQAATYEPRMRGGTYRLIRRGVKEGMIGDPSDIVESYPTATLGADNITGGNMGAPMDSPESGTLAAPAGEPMGYMNPGGAKMQRPMFAQGSPSISSSLDFATCATEAWDPAATAEAQALATVGSLQHDNFGEWMLQSAINATYDSNSSALSDAQLQQIMANGGMP